MKKKQAKPPVNCPVCEWPLVNRISVEEVQRPCPSCGSILKISAEDQGLLALSLLSALPLPLYAIVGFVFALFSHKATDAEIVADADATLQSKPEWLAFLDAKKSAEAGDAACQFKMGRETELGYWIDGSEVKALEWYRKSADQGYVPAQQALGRMYFMGQGTVRDYAESYFWYYVAERNGEDREWSESVGRYLSAMQMIAQQQRAAIWRPTAARAS